MASCRGVAPLSPAPVPRFLPVQGSSGEDSPDEARPRQRQSVPSCARAPGYAPATHPERDNQAFARARAVAPRSRLLQVVGRRGRGQARRPSIQQPPRCRLPTLRPALPRSFLSRPGTGSDPAGSPSWRSKRCQTRDLPVPTRDAQHRRTRAGEPPPTAAVPGMYSIWMTLRNWARLTRTSMPFMLFRTLLLRRIIGTARRDSFILRLISTSNRR